MNIEETKNIIAASIYIYSIAACLPENCKLKRVIKKGIIKRQLPQRSIQPLSINDCLNFDENNEIIERFMKILEEKFSHCDLSSLYFNIRNLKILETNKRPIDKLRELLSLEAAGTYQIGQNKITVYEESNNSSTEKRNTKYHELLHMASSRKGCLSEFCGFYKKIANFTIGRGLNEGYTNVLTNRSFVEEEYDLSYEKLQMIAIGIELLVGSMKMEQLYFTNDLEGLINELKKYATEEEILSLLIKIDKIEKSTTKTESQEQKESALARKIRTDIANMRIKDLEIARSEGIIDEHQFINSLLELEFYASGYIRYYLGTSSDNRDVYVLSQYPFDNYAITDPKILYEQYQELAIKYYQSKRNNNYQITYDPWKDEHGNTVEEILHNYSSGININFKEDSNTELNYLYPQFDIEVVQSIENKESTEENKDLSEMFDFESKDSPNIQVTHNR